MATPEIADQSAGVLWIRDDVDDLEHRSRIPLSPRRPTACEDRYPREVRPMAHDEVADMPAPKIISSELASLRTVCANYWTQHPTAQVTVTAYHRARHSRRGLGFRRDSRLTPYCATVREMMSPEIDASGRLRPRCSRCRCTICRPELRLPGCSWRICRAVKKLLIVDLPRPPAPLHIALLAVVPHRSPESLRCSTTDS